MQSVNAGYPDPIRAPLIANPEIVIEETSGRLSEGNVFVAARRGERLAGFAVASVELNLSQADLVAMFVEPDSWRKGIGTELTDFIARKLSALGVDRLYVVANPAAGFVPDGLAQMANYGLAADGPQSAPYWTLFSTLLGLCPRASSFRRRWLLRMPWSRFVPLTISGRRWAPGLVSVATVWNGRGVPFGPAVFDGELCPSSMGGNPGAMGKL